MDQIQGIESITCKREWIKIFVNLITDDCHYRTICLVKLKRRPSSGTRAVCYP